MINSIDSNQIIATFNANAEQVLLQVGYDKMSLEDQNSLVIVIGNKLNIPYSNVTSDYILNYHKTAKINMLSQCCDDQICGGFVSSLNNHTYRTNRDDQLNMIGQKDALDADSTITTVSWKTQDVGYVSHTRADWMTIYNQAFNFKKAQLNQYAQLKAQVNDPTVTTHAQIVNIKWPTSTTTPPTQS